MFNRKATEGKTALHLAVQLLQVEIVHNLLNYPSPQVALELLNKQTRTGVTPLRAARRMICSSPQQKDALANIVQMLVGAGGIDSPYDPDESFRRGSDSDSECEESMRSESSSPLGDVRARGVS